MSTIVACATSRGKGAIAVLRVSGPAALEILSRVFIPARKGAFSSHQMRYGVLRAPGTDEELDEIMAVFMAAPNTYTGEDTAELYLHGNALIIDGVLAACVAAGAEHAKAGEFTQRAFQNGKLDLSQAEAVMELISARTERERRSALAGMRGAAGREILVLQDALTDLLAEVEAELNYPEEDLPNLDAEALRGRIEALERQLTNARDTALMNERARRGFRVALAGRTNAGKSSLVNLLTGIDRVMVSEFPGTTRDVVEAEIVIEGMRVILCDTAGLRESGDVLEREGQRRARQALESADAILAVTDATLPAEELELPESIPVLRVFNKTDLLQPDRVAALPPGLRVSAKTGAGLEELLAALGKLCAEGTGETWLSGARAVSEVGRAIAALREASSALEGQTLDILAEELREAWDALGAVTGRTVSEDIIDRVFQKFCLGK